MSALAQSAAHEETLCTSFEAPEEGTLISLTMEARRGLKFTFFFHEMFYIFFFVAYQLQKLSEFKSGKRQL